ncbi:hypothetical protein Back2_21350 [Nocardioides baekrokdamisoli]|uniref:Uncharacterized protein n=1 Tax=Nocardioides baekrokdamisoli TaxID=1804624 RepID=A0A3G9J2N0_9ACTN|nr:hypothetical protein [Nocardioides baekrokdamisoli]BBH17848.1 hypothetical protein Back2_21350 [Nocardioides baekrokdamisoli]
MTKKSYVAENGLTLGLIGLAVLVIFAVALPRWTHHQDFKAIKLPATIDGGYTLVDASVSPQLKQVLSQLSDSASKAEGVGATSALYKSAADTFAVTAVRKGSSTAPMMVPLSAIGTYSKVGDDTCFQASSQSSPYTACFRSSAELTVEVTSSAAPADLAKHLDEIWKKTS